MAGAFNTYDPSNGTENKVEGPLTAILAYEREGALLDPVQDGQLRVVVVSPKADNLIDGHWMVKWVNRMELKDTGSNWILHLKGALSEDMDRATFESGSSAHCHLEAWTDEEGNEWTGIPLWYLIGRVDDEVRHESRAFNDDLANAGYTITITAVDGYSIELNSKDAAFNDKWIVALNVNGEPISDKNYPLRLVGEGLTKDQMIGAIDSITLDIEPLPEATEAAATEVPTDDARTMEGDLVISGNVEFTMPFQYEELKGMNVITINTKHPKKDEMRDYEGVRLNDLLEMAKPKADASKLTFVAGDGYSTSLPLADVLACADCLISFGEDNTLNSVMPGMDSGFWAKDVKQIVIE
jgi:DMSO/TMAO reductase YedYZ molybdopterin-dependent catalytic subunit